MEQLYNEEQEEEGEIVEYNKQHKIVVEKLIENAEITETVSLLTTRDMNENFSIDLITNKPTTSDHKQKDEEPDDNNYEKENNATGEQQINKAAIEELQNVNRQNLHMDFNVNEIDVNIKNDYDEDIKGQRDGKNDENMKMDDDEQNSLAKTEPNISGLKGIIEEEEEEEVVEVSNKNVEVEEKEAVQVKVETSNDINEYKQQTRFNKEEVELKKNDFIENDNNTITKQKLQQQQQEQQEKLPEKLKTSVSLNKDIKQQSQNDKMQIYNNNNMYDNINQNLNLDLNETPTTTITHIEDEEEEEKEKAFKSENNNNNNNNSIVVVNSLLTDVIAKSNGTTTQITRMNTFKAHTNDDDIVSVTETVNKTILVSDIYNKMIPTHFEAVDKNNDNNKDYDDNNENKNENDKDVVVDHDVDIYWNKTNQVDNVDDKAIIATTTTNEIPYIYVNNCENNTALDDGFLMAITTIKPIQNVHKTMKFDKFKLNDHQIDATTTIEKVEQHLMETNEQMLIDSVSLTTDMIVNEKEKKNTENEEEEKEEEEEEMGKLTPQHLLLDELMLNDAASVQQQQQQQQQQHYKHKVMENIVKSPNDVLNYIDNETEDIDIINLEDKDTNNKKKKQPTPTDELLYKTLPAPKVSESFDRPSKRILVNVTIATDDADGSIYTLHVAVPTGRGKDEEKNIEQVLTHERHHSESIDTNAAYCYPEPPPPIPECPCACSDFTLTTDNIDLSEHENILTERNLETTISATIENVNLTMHDNDIDIDTITITSMGVDNITTTTATPNSFTACPDVMPILILEGVCCLSYNFFPFPI